MNKQLAATMLLTAAGIWQGGSWSQAQSQTAANTPPIVSAPAPDSVAAADPGELNESNSTFVEREAAGISLRIPSGCRQVFASGNGDSIGQYADPIRKWEIKLQRIIHDDTMSLTGSVDNDGKPIPGLLDKVARDMRLNLSGVIVRQDVVNIADPGVSAQKDGNNVGMVAIRYTSGGSRYLLQQALVRSTDRMFFSITLTTPIGDGKLDADTATQQEVAAVKTFGRVVDSIHLLDTAAIKRNQNERLFRTQILLTQLRSHARLQNAMIPKQWLRVTRNGRDMGYSFVTEQNADGPLLANKAGQAAQPPSGDGLLVGVRARSIVEPDANASAATAKPVQVDVAGWWFLSGDQNQEQWSRVTVTTDLGPDGKPTAKLKQQQFTESGSTGLESHTRLDKNALPGSKIDPYQPPVTKLEQRVLNVTSIDATGASKPFAQALPPEWYLPQAFALMLPRLVPLRPDAANTPRSYMFCTYIPEVRQVMYRYVDVGQEGDFDLGGQTIHAIPISDHLGWHGSVTTHYVSAAGEYLGSENKDTHTVTRPSTAEELLKIWKNANLTQPDPVQKDKADGAASATTPRQPVPSRPDSEIDRQSQLLANTAGSSSGK
jgi:hypothetical protein